MEGLQVFLLAVVQGIAEFLPISSSGHLAVLGQVFGFDPESNVRLNVILHAGTLLAILIFYFHTLWNILVNKSQWRIIGLVVVGSIPAAVIGLGIKKTGLDMQLFNNLLTPGIGFLLTALMLQFAMQRKVNAENGLALERMNFKQALGIGVAQGIAIVPGISRSGSTIAAALRCRITPADSAKFSFLLAIPAIGGAALLDLLEALKAGPDATASDGSIALWMLVMGFVVSAVVGFFALKILLKLLQRGKLQWFSWYLYCVGVLVLLYWAYCNWFRR
ncbi:undecaprenyl-diphosphate phosphatase [Victivallis sp. Marseille-Q1083]|uniref:undecaprenyl-diphosphate phosphatase n=1 Tax=Victivallis sp. Marseille-Q1083 TaxID=2717288 RepID=UPI0015890043|nr:undecaprenyl-diphosphate phosphatase [Victivallis sp. Marseille-Q1083]